MKNFTCQTSSSGFSHWILPCFLVSWSPAASARDIQEAAAVTPHSDIGADFAQAASRFRAGDYAAALEIFTALSEQTQSPNVQLYIGYCYVKLGRPLDAHRAFSRTLEQTNKLNIPKYQATRDAAQEQLAALNQRLSKLTIFLVTPLRGAAVKLDGDPIELRQLDRPLTIEPGVHVIEAEAPGANTVVKSVTLEKGTNKTVAVLLQNQSAQHPPDAAPHDAARAQGSGRSSYTTLGWAAAGVGLVGWSLFAVAGLRTKSIYDSLQEQCPNRCSDSAHQREVNSGNAWQITANAGLAVGILGTVSAAALLGVSAAQASDQRTSAGLQLGSHFAQVSYQGRF